MNLIKYNDLSLQKQVSTVKRVKSFLSFEMFAVASLARFVSFWHRNTLIATSFATFVKSQFPFVVKRSSCSKHLLTSNYLVSDEMVLITVAHNIG